MIHTSAPGKVILFGEHSVVYPDAIFSKTNPHWGLAAAIDIRAHANLQVIKVGDSFIYSGEYRASVKEILGDKYHYLYPIVKIFEKVGFKKKFQLEIHSEVPSGSNLGSSSSTFTAIAGALYAASNDFDIQKISQLAYTGDVVAHGGTPSGIDTTVSSYGGYLKYTKVSSDKNSFENLDLPAINILITKTGVQGNTSKAVQSVRKRIQEDMSTLDLLDSINEHVDKGIDALRKEDMKSLGQAMLANHEILQKVGVSHPKADELVKISMENGAYGAKMTGGGQGGCIIAIGQDLAQIEAAMHSAGYETFITKLGADGVRKE